MVDRFESGMHTMFDGKPSGAAAGQEEVLVATMQVAEI